MSVRSALIRRAQASPEAAEREQQLRRQLARHRDLDITFASEGWASIDEMLAAEETKATQQLEGAATSLEEIYAQRERLRLIRWFRALPASNRREREKAEHELGDYEPREGE